MTAGSYWPSAWPVEGGASHRPNTAPSAGLGVQPTERLVVTTRHTGRWPVMFVQRDAGQLFLHGTTTAAEAEVAGWVERVDPVTLDPVASAARLPTGGHEWRGSIVAHANGDLYTVGGSYLHRLDLACRIRGERALPIDHAHDGLLILGDGSLITKDVRLGEAPSTLTVCDQDLEVQARLELPEASMGRLAVVHTGDGDDIYVVGTTRLFRYRWSGGALLTDHTWQPRYRRSDQGGLAWEASIVDGWAWVMDNGSHDEVQHRFSQVPPVRVPLRSARELPDSTWNDPVRVIGVSIDDPQDTVEIIPTETSGGWVAASPLVHDDVVVAWDTCGMGLAGFDVSRRSKPEMLWYQPFRPSMQPLLYPDTGELLVNDFRMLADDETSDDLVVLDVRTGQMKSRVATGATRMSNTFLCPGWRRDVYYCAPGTVARIRVESAR